LGLAPENADDPYAILWDFTFLRNGNLTWCSKNSPKGPMTVPVPVEGSLKEPFVVVSIKKDGKISLQALPMDDDKYSFPVFCISDQNTFESCRNGSKRGLKNINYWNETGSFEVEFGNKTTEFDMAEQLAEDMEDY